MFLRIALRYLIKNYQQVLLPERVRYIYNKRLDELFDLDELIVFVMYEFKEYTKLKKKKKN